MVLINPEDSDPVHLVTATVDIESGDLYVHESGFNPMWKYLRNSMKDKRYDFDKFYSDKACRSQLVKEMANFFLVKTVQFLFSTAKDNGKSNINNRVRSATCEKKYLEALRNNIGFDMNVASEYSDLMTAYKTVQL